MIEQEIELGRDLHVNPDNHVILSKTDFLLITRLLNPAFLPEQVEEMPPNRTGTCGCSAFQNFRNFQTALNMDHPVQVDAEHFNLDVSKQLVDVAGWIFQQQRTEIEYLYVMPAIREESL